MSAEAAVGAAATGEGQADLQAVRVPGLTRDEARGVVTRRVKAAKRAQEDAERRKASAVWWQQEDCPHWCRETHTAWTAPDERTHDSDDLMVIQESGLVLGAPSGSSVRVDGRPTGSPPYVAVFLRQHTGAARPVVMIQTGAGSACSTRTVTLDAARDLAVKLLRLADIAEGIDQ